MIRNISILTTLITLSFNLLHAQDAYLGVHYNHVSDEKKEFYDLPDENLLQITRVVEGSGAYEGGLQPFDVMLEVNGIAIKSGHDLGEVVDEAGIGEIIPVVVRRLGQNERVTRFVRIGDEADARPMAISNMNQAFYGISHHSNPPEGTPGVVVGVVDQSAAKEAGVQDGDVIERINGQVIMDWHDVSTVIDNMMPGENIATVVRRGNDVFEFNTPIKSLYETHGGIVHMDVENMEVEIVALPINEVDPALVNLVPELKNVKLTNNKNDAQPLRASNNTDNGNANSNIELEVAQLNLFPNPNNGMFNLQLKFAENDPAIIQIFDAKGRRVYQRMIQMPEIEFQDYVDLSNTGVGQYILLVQQGQKRLTRKVVVTNL